MIVKGSALGASFVLVGLGVLVLLDACGSSKLAGSGGECFVADDCEIGLVCIEQKSGSRICTNDLTAAAGTIPPDGAAPDAGDAGEGGTGEGGTTKPDDAGTPTKDSSTPPPPPPVDSGPPPPVDSGPGDSGGD